MFAVQLVGENWFDICFLSEVLYVKISILNKKIPISREKGLLFCSMETFREGECGY